MHTWGFPQTSSRLSSFQRKAEPVCRAEGALPGVRAEGFLAPRLLGQTQHFRPQPRCVGAREPFQLRVLDPATFQCFEEEPQPYHFTHNTASRKGPSKWEPRGFRSAPSRFG